MTKHLFFTCFIFLCVTSVFSQHFSGRKSFLQTDVTKRVAVGNDTVSVTISHDSIYVATNNSHLYLLVMYGDHYQDIRLGNHSSIYFPEWMVGNSFWYSPPDPQSGKSDTAIFLRGLDELHHFGYPFKKLDGYVFDTQFMEKTKLCSLTFHTFPDSLIVGDQEPSGVVSYDGATFIYKLPLFHLIVDVSDLQNPLVNMIRFPSRYIRAGEKIQKEWGRQL